MMDRSEARQLAQKELQVIADAGYPSAAEHIETVICKEVCAADGTHYDMELSYHWKGEVHEDILVICTLTSKDWFSHERLEESTTLTFGAD